MPGEHGLDIYIRNINPRGRVSHLVYQRESACRVGRHAAAAAFYVWLINNIVGNHAVLVLLNSLAAAARTAHIYCTTP